MAIYKEDVFYLCVCVCSYDINQRIELNHFVSGESTA